MKIFIFQRLRSGARSPNYSYKFTWHGRQVARATNISAEVAGGTREAIAMVRKRALAHLRALEVGALDLAETEFRRRTNKEWPTIGQLFAAHSLAARGLLRARTVTECHRALLNILRRAGSAGFQAGVSVPSEALPITILDSRLRKRFAAATLAQAEREQAGERRERQLKRSANSIWIMARGLFANRRIRAAYHDAQLSLPPCIEDFMADLPFDPKKCEKGQDYQMPPPHTIRATFDDLEAVQRAQNPNLYAAVWLALGFGLRKGEIIGARVRDLQERNGTWGFQVNENWIERKDTGLPKAGPCPQQPWIPAANDCMAHLAPLLVGRPAQDYILTGPHLSCRTDYVWRDVSRWMRSLGWGTQKTIHEFRAYGACQVGMEAHRRGENGIRAAQSWLRHQTVTTTEKAYSHYFQTAIRDAPMVLPEPAPFNPQNQASA